MVVLLGLLLGCGSDAALVELEDCTEAACARAWVLERWPEDPEGTEDRIRALNDPILTLMLAEAVAETWPGRAASVCQLIPEGPSRRRCTSIHQRLHLHSDRPEDAATRRGFGGELVERLVVSPAGAQSWDAVPVETPQCAAQDTPTGCATALAIDAARRGQASQVAGLCRSIPEGRWRGECFFEAVELGCSVKAPERCTRLAPLCLAAAPFDVPCFVQVVEELTAMAPRADAPAPEAWAKLRAAVDGLEAEVSSRDATLAAPLIDRLWASIVQRSYAQATHASGDLTASVPVRAMPHVRASLAWRLAAQGTESPRRLATRISAAIQARGEAGEPLGPPKSAPPAGLWSEVLPLETSWHVVSYLGDPRRVAVDDPELDGLICALEATARLHPAPEPALRAALTHEDPAVRWTAARLLGHRVPGHPALEAVLDDLDPRVQARARAGLQRR
ncbi:MAG: HEAT repeat domain-containing protein [Alphaproteobacteria bacterium]|nr:HEAT repeat domain-containing protein [Alphaproteobacteria bacterium]